MEVRNCRSCGRLFNYMGGAPLCPACQKKLEEKFQEVKAFLEENPNSSVETVAEELDVLGEADQTVDSRGASVTFRGRSRRHCL